MSTYQYSADFVTVVATIAAKATAHPRLTMAPADAVDFAWFSVNETGDASEDDAALERHLQAYANYRAKADR